MQTILLKIGQRHAKRQEAVATAFLGDLQGRGTCTYDAVNHGTTQYRVELEHSP